MLSLKRPDESQEEWDAALAKARAATDAEMAALIVQPCEFWFVWTKTGHVPRHSHHTEASALREAERLARKRPGKKFIVLRSVTKMHVAV